MSAQSSRSPRPQDPSRDGRRRGGLKDTVKAPLIFSAALGLVGGIVSVVLIFIIFSNTAAENSGWILLIGMPVAGLIGGLWAGISSARRR